MEDAASPKGAGVARNKAIAYCKRAAVEGDATAVVDDVAAGDGQAGDINRDVINCENSKVRRTTRRAPHDSQRTRAGSVDVNVVTDRW